MNLPSPSLIHLILMCLALILAVVQIAVSFKDIVSHHFFWGIGSVAHGLLLSAYLGAFMWLHRRPVQFVRITSDIIYLGIFAVWGIVAIVFFGGISGGSTFFVLAALLFEVGYILLGGQEADRWTGSFWELCERRIVTARGGVPK